MRVRGICEYIRIAFDIVRAGACAYILDTPFALLKKLDLEKVVEHVVIQRHIIHRQDSIASGISFK